MPALNYVAIVNPRSGNGKTADGLEQIKQRIARHCGDIPYWLTSGPKDATQLTAKALAEGYTAIISVGGDGTHHEVVNGFFEGEQPRNTDAVFCPVTSGTGSDFAKTMRELGFTNDGFDHLAGNSCLPIGVGHYRCATALGKDTEGVFINLFDAGYGAEVVALVNRSSKVLGGFLSFFIGGLRALYAYQPVPMRVFADDKLVSQGKIFMAFLGNGRYCGGGIKLVPDADPRLPSLDGTFLFDYDKARWIKDVLGKRVYSGEIVKQGEVPTARAAVFRFEADQPVALEADGETVGITPCTVKVLPTSLLLKVI